MDAGIEDASCSYRLQFFLAQATTNSLKVDAVTFFVLEIAALLVMRLFKPTSIGAIDVLCQTHSFLCTASIN